MNDGAPGAPWACSGFTVRLRRCELYELGVRVANRRLVNVRADRQRQPRLDLSLNCGAFIVGHFVCRALT